MSVSQRRCLTASAITTLLVFVGIAGHASAQSPGATVMFRAQDTVPQTVLLWPAGAPNALGNEPDDRPSITIYRPRQGATKTAVLVAPGGAYMFLASGVEGDDVARWLVTHGVTAAVLQYRHGPRYHHPIPLQDAQRAIRWLRAHAAELGVAPDRIGMMGFSAGGHLTATAGTQFDAGHPASNDPIDRQSSRPDFLILGYPVISFERSVAGPYPLAMYAGSGSFLLGETAPDSMLRRMSAELNVTAKTPPTFLYHGTADRLVNVENSVVFYLALRKAGVPAELHTFEKADHGGGLNLGDPVLGVWPVLLLHWMEGHGLLSGAASSQNSGAR